MMTPRQLSMLATEHKYRINPQAQRPLAEQTQRAETAGTAAWALMLGAKAAESRSGHGAPA